MVKSLNKFVTNAAIAGTISQGLLETFTNPLVTTAMWRDKLYGALFKGTREFSAKSYAQAFKLVAMTHGKEKSSDRSHRSNLRYSYFRYCCA
jgi:hypothetical protein